MFSRILAVASLAALAIAGPLNARGGTPSQQCNTGTLQCCQQVQQTSDLQQFLSSFGLVDALAGASALVGANCNPVSVLGTGNGAQCNTQPVCCTSNQMLGAVNMGCMPLNVNA
ncbi:fungal hydrophobin-domain-containing protein [Pisolithus microcarpus]|nr:fungal hydrophobin-domain-containing protein [Pisolithus microcarpus]